VKNINYYLAYDTRGDGVGIRAFISIDIDDPIVLREIIKLRDLVVSTGVPMKPVEDENIHLTLRFLGNIPESLVDEIHNIMKAIKFKAFTIHIKGLGCFPRITRPRVIWVGVSKGSDELKRIRNELERGLRRLGFKPEAEEFIPHITIARVKGSARIQSLIKVLNEYQDHDIGFMEVKSIRLKQSILTPRGPIYKTLKEVKAEE